jgi:uncharacterized protein
MKYLDSNIFIYPVIYPNSTKGGSAKEILTKLVKGEVQAITSSLTWDELIWAIRKESSFSIAITEGRRFLEIPNLKIVSVDENILYSAQKLIEEYKIAPRDAIHASTAIARNAIEFITDDSDFNKIKEIRRIPI